MLFPFFLTSNWFYTWQFNDYNGALFTLRTRALNNMLYWFFQIFGAMVFGIAIDSSRFRRRVRGWAGLGVVTMLSMAVWGGCYSFQMSVVAIILPRLSLTVLSNAAVTQGLTLE